MNRIDYVRANYPTFNEKLYLSFGKVIRKVPIEKIFIDKERLNNANPIFEDTVNTIIENFDDFQWNPINVDDEFYLRDGQHRLEVAKRMGLKYIDVQIWNFDYLALQNYKPSYYKKLAKENI